MLSAIMKIKPQLDNKDLKAMEKSLQSRFTRIAKGFGKGLANVLKGGGLLGIGLGILDKVLNPLKETQEAIDRMLTSSDDIATNAKAFDTTSGKLFKLIQLGNATGLDQDGLFTLIQKFQTAVAQAKADPNDASVSSVRNFVGQEDTAEGFFNFIQSVQRMDKSSQLLVQKQVFGEKQILKMADFLQSDFKALAGRIGIDKVSSNTLSAQNDKLAGFKDLDDELAARRNVQDLGAKASSINEGMVRAKDKAERVALERQNAQIRSYTDLQKISTTVESMMKLMDTGMAMLGKLITFLEPAVMKIVSALEALMKSPMIRGVGKWFGKGD